MIRNSKTPQESNSTSDAESTGASSSVDRRQVLQSLAGGAAMAVVGSRASTAELGQPRSDPLSGKRVYADPSLRMGEALTRTTSDPDPAEADLALLATETELEQDIVYDFLTDKTPVSIVGNRADIHAIDYLTDGEGSIDGVSVSATFADDLGDVSTFDPEPTAELDSRFGYELTLNQVSESAILYPTGETINVHVNFGTEGRLRTSALGRNSAESRRLLDNIGRSLAVEKGVSLTVDDDDEESEGSHRYCQKGDLSCGGKYYATGEPRGGEWKKRVVAGFTDLSTTETSWAVRSRLRMTPDRSPRVRQYKNKYFRRENQFQGGEIHQEPFVDESEPPSAGDVKNMSYSIGIGSDGSASAEWTETTVAAELSIDHMEHTDEVYHKFHSLADFNAENTVYGEPMCRVRTGTGPLKYTYEDKMKWQREWGQGDGVNLEGTGRWTQY